MDKLEPDSWDSDRDGLYCGWYKRRAVKKNEIDRAIKAVEKKYGKRADKLKQRKSGM